jgi:hypothetical protein
MIILERVTCATEFIWIIRRQELELLGHQKLILVMLISRVVELVCMLTNSACELDLST